MSTNVQIKPFRKVLVANRGEIAIRVFRALNELGIQTVSIFSKEDKYALFHSKADESYPLNPDKGPIDAYLDIDTIIRIALAANVDAIHPGYGFLSENPDFVDACEKNGIVFIGPSSDIMNAMGDKISSKKMAIAAEVPIIPGVDYAIKEVEAAKEIAAKVGFPIMLKASNGGGGRGMRIVDRMEDLEKEFNEAKNESKKAFGDDKIFIEKYLLTISGYIAFNFLIPIACIFAILYVLLKNQKAGAIAGKLCAFSMVLLLVVPMSVQLSELIDQTYQISLEQNIEDTEELIEDSTEFSEENVQEGSNWLENIGNIISDNLSSLTSGISDLVNKGETLLSDILETIAVMIITACFIPILVFLILFWATKLIIGVEISLPQIKPKRRKQLKGNESLIEYTEIKN